MNAQNTVIRCPIHGSISINKQELKLIDSPYVQRLRNISQLGFASFVFPGAVHTRFSHSIGVMHLAGRIYDQLVLSQVSSLKDYYTGDQLNYYRKILRFSALLHDVGHPPFSHAAEALLPPISSLDSYNLLNSKEDRQSTHEDFSYMVINSMAKEDGLLTEEEASDIISVLSKSGNPSDRMNSNIGQPMIYPLLCQLITGEVDVDRMDYLLRDSYFAGVPYGKFDLDRLVNSFSCWLEENSGYFLLAIDGEGVPSYEIFLLARVHMFYQIYFHKSLGAYRHYLKMAFKENEVDFEIDGSIKNFFHSTETGLLEEFRKNRKKKWSGRIFNRTPAKNLIRVLDGEKSKYIKLQKVEKILIDHNIETFVAHSSNQFSSQIKNKKINQETILVIDQEFGAKTILPIAEKSTLLGSEEKQIVIMQLYVHREDYNRAIKIIRKCLNSTT